MVNENNDMLSSDSSRSTIDIQKYVTQLEKRVSEQETLIELLKEKVSSLEASSGTPHSSSGGTKSSYSKVVRTPAAPEVAPITGSRKSGIAAVQTTRYSHFFITRIKPSVSAAELTLDLLTYATELKSVICSKMSTKHSSYSSFHLSVLEEQKHLVSSDEAWPEGVLVKPFIGKLLKNYVTEKYDSLNPGGSSSPQENVSETPNATDASGSSNSSKNQVEKTSISLSGKGGNTTRTFRGTSSNRAQQSPSTNSPKNGIQTRSNVKK